MDLLFLLLILESFALSEQSFLNPSPLHHPDRVLSLPGAPVLPKFNLFSGYLNGSSTKEEIPIFYVLAEAIRVDPSTAPLIVWFNGGPGASSLYGFFLEHGPYRMTESGDELAYNEFSWNQYANVLYLESPLGVGFSQNGARNMTLNDIDATEINYNALLDFMMRVHPQYEDREYFLSGQSYAGVYVPALALRLLVEIPKREIDGVSGKINRNCKGFAIGNPVFNLMTLRLASLLQLFNNGLVSLNHAELVLGSWLKHEKGEEFSDDVVDELMKIYEKVITDNIGINAHAEYNLNYHCYRHPHFSPENYHYPTENKSSACFGSHSLTSYTNRIDVQTALHVANITMGTQKWTGLNYEQNSKYKRLHYILYVYRGIFSFIQDRLPSFRILIYNGDTDAKIPPVHTIHSAAMIAQNNSLEYQNYEGEWRFYNDFAGIRTGYRKGNVTMDVLTVRGAGHSVPTDLPAQAFQMINNFIFAEDNGEVNYSKPIQKTSQNLK